MGLLYNFIQSVSICHQGSLWLRGAVGGANKQVETMTHPWCHGKKTSLWKVSLCSFICEEFLTQTIKNCICQNHSLSVIRSFMTVKFRERREWRWNKELKTQAQMSIVHNCVCVCVGGGLNQARDVQRILLWGRRRKPYDLGWCWEGCGIRNGSKELTKNMKNKKKEKEIWNLTSIKPFFPFYPPNLSVVLLLSCRICQSSCVNGFLPQQSGLLNTPLGEDALYSCTPDQSHVSTVYSILLFVYLHIPVNHIWQLW